MTDDSRHVEEILAEHREGEEPPETDEEAGDPLDPFAGIDPVRPGAAGAGSAEPDAEEDPLPDAPLFALLRSIETELGPERIDRIWVFPPRRLEARETALVVVGVFHESDPDRRRVYAAHYTAIEDADSPRLVLQEYGNAPTDRVGRLVEEVVDRLGDDPAGAPRSHDIAGAGDRWAAVLHELAHADLDQARRHPGLR